MKDGGEEVEVRYAFGELGARGGVRVGGDEGAAGLEGEDRVCFDEELDPFPFLKGKGKGKGKREGRTVSFPGTLNCLILIHGRQARVSSVHQQPKPHYI